MAKRRYRFIVEVETDIEVLREKYPNWRYNYQTAAEFAQELICGLNQLDSEYGYTVIAIPVEG